MSRIRKGGLLAAAAALAALIVLTGIAASGDDGNEGAGEPGNAVAEATHESIEPEFEWQPSTVTETQRLELQRRFEAVKERLQSRYPTSVPGPAVSIADLTTAPETFAGSFEAELVDNPAAVRRLRKRNTKANNANTLAEPVAANTGDHVLAGGNTHFEYSTNSAVDWTTISIPGGPSYAPDDCCDPDVQHFPGRGVTIYSLLYLDSAVTRGAVRLFVRRSVPDATNCTYTLNYGEGVLPDYPHLGRSNDYLYLSTNNIDNTTGWTGSQMKRISLDDIVDCESATVWTYTYVGSVDQRVFVPAEGVTEAMYWVTNENTTQSRVFSWPEDSDTVSSWLVDRSESTFANPDCRGGVDNYDWIEIQSAWSIAGFRVRSAMKKHRYLCSYWNVGPDGSHPQGHVHAACFDISESPPTLAAQPHIWNSGTCFGYPAVSTNSRGDLGLSIGLGGQAGGGGSAAEGYIGIDDDFTAGMGFFQTVYKTAPGDRNRSDGRHGDYYTVRPSYPCDLGFIGTNYGLLANSRNVRVVRFSRGRDWQCMREWQRKPNPTFD